MKAQFVVYSTVVALAACSSEATQGSTDAALQNSGGLPAQAGSGGASVGGASNGTSGANVGGDGTVINGGAPSNAGAPNLGGAANNGGTAGSVSAGGMGIGGTAGSVSAAGSAQAGGGGAAGTGGSVGAAGASGRPSGPSAGCAAPLPPDEPGAAIQHDMMVTVAAQYQPTYVPRYYYTVMPTGYNHATPYPVVFRGNGCGQTQAEGGAYSGSSEVFLVQMIPASVTGDTVVPPGGSPGCFQAGRRGLADSPDGPYFDQALAEVAATYCIDMGQVYAGGWSSGAWLANYLACARGNVIRGTVSGSGGLQHDHGECTGGAAVMIFPGDAANTDQDGFDIGAAPARDLFIQTNGCSTTPTTMGFGNAGNCEYYGGCDAPVVYCTDGGGHGGPLGFIQDSSWEFWNSLP